MALSALFFFCLLVSSVLADPIQIRSSSVTLPLAVKINSTGGAQALINRDRARGRALFAHGQAKAKLADVPDLITDAGAQALISQDSVRGHALFAHGQTKGKEQEFADIPIPITDAGQIYAASVGVGRGTYSLMVDTGSSNTWVGAVKAYQPGPNSQDTGETVSGSYGSGKFSGEEYTDDVTLGSATIRNQSIGVASSSIGMNGFDGILGLGPVGLTSGTTSDGGLIPTVTDNLASQGIISTALLGVSFVPTTSLDDVNGELVFGTVDSSKFTGEISFVPTTRRSPSSHFWGIEQSITYGPAGTPILNTGAGIIDTGATLILLASDAFQAYQHATGAKFDQATGLLTVADPSTLQSLFFKVGGQTFEFTSNAQIWPRAFNLQIGGQPGQTYLIVSDVGHNSGRGLDFINGFTFLQRFYSVYDTTNSQVGLATTPHTHDTSN